MKKIEIILKDNKIEVDFEGFQGDFCYRESEKLQQELKKLGVSFDGYTNKQKMERLARNEPLKIRR